MSIKILIVDDSNKARSTLKAILKEHEVHEADSGIKGLELAYAISPELIIMDTIMPTMDGYSALKMLKENPKTKDIPIVVTLERAMSFDVYRSSQLGAAKVLIKPFKKEEVLEALKVASAPYLKHCLEKELDSSNQTKSPLVKV